MKVSLNRAFFAEEDPRDDVEDQHRQGDQQGAAPGQAHPVVVGTHGELEYHHRQIGHRCVHVKGHKLIVQCSE